MKLLLSPEEGIVFDLDDTLYKERDFVRSGFKAISQLLGEGHASDATARMFSWWESGEKNVFQKAAQSLPFNISSDEMLEIYRTHHPEISVSHKVSSLLEAIKGSGIPIGLITDGRAVTQRAKLKALNLSDFFDAVIISEEVGSEKPDPKNFKAVAEKMGVTKSIYIGDNVRKDFIAPKQLGWTTICLRNDGLNIHPQIFPQPFEKMPDLILDELALEAFSFTSAP